MSTSSHIAVMLSESLDALNLQENAKYIDATFGAGGHSRAMLEHNLKLLSIDQDATVLEYEKELRKSLSKAQNANFKLSITNFRGLKETAQKHDFNKINGIVFDLGVSSMQLDQAERGFAFRQDGPLDMRMGNATESAEAIVNNLEEEKLAAIIYRYGEERLSRRIAKAIVEARQTKPIKTTSDLAEIIVSAYPKGRYRKKHPARQTFQALRIYVNDELRALEDALEAATELLDITGRLVVISYHSLEDRIVKHFIKDDSNLKILTKKPITASLEEIRLNPRARSAKLRIAEKTRGRE